MTALDALRLIGNSAGIRRRLKKFFRKVAPSDNQCPTLSCRVIRMRTKSLRRSRPTLLPVPYSSRPDRIERGLRMLRALRLSLAAAPTPVRAQQCEFAFALQK
jgi:hypothetical protein